MFKNFEYISIPLADILLDDRNPRIVTQQKLTTQEAIIAYLFEHEDLAGFIKKIVLQGKNKGAERPYVVKNGKSYIVVEGNTRIAAYKLLTGLLKAPHEYSGDVPSVSKSFSESLKTVDCSVAPHRDALLPIMANAHFGLGDKSKWGYLGSRKAVFDEWESGKTIAQLAKAFDRTKGQINDLILEYKLYLEALKLNLKKEEKDKLLDPIVEFNPPVRFLQTRGHKSKVGISYDKVNLKINFSDSTAKKKFKHLIYKLVISPQQGLGATATYDEVFADFVSASTSPQGKKGKDDDGQQKGDEAEGKKSGSAEGSSQSGGGPSGTTKPTLKAGALFAYPVTASHSLLTQLMREARDLNSKKYPAAATFLLRNIVEALLKHIIHSQKANPSTKTLDLEACLNLCKSTAVDITAEDKKILKEFQKTHLSYLNLGAHGNVIPNHDRLLSARDCIDEFIRKNI